MENEGEKMKGWHGEGYEILKREKDDGNLSFLYNNKQKQEKTKELDVLKFNITHLKERKGRDNPIPACEKIHRFVGK